MSRPSVTVTLLVPLIFVSSLVADCFALPVSASPPGDPIRAAPAVVIEFPDLLERSVRGLLRRAPLPTTGSAIAHSRGADAAVPW
ncbi:hypothetical protein [Nocardia higoensis]|uniref:hypothetical protein n=1 Tax=Nocardia higoensis TaxID=228599 RepID=UPI0002E01BA9|nr:hypothetical protein [Nocardia higoensis]